MTRLVYVALVCSFFRLSAPRVLRMYQPLARRVMQGPFPDYRPVLARIIGDYLFRCPNQYFASLLAAPTHSTPVPFASAPAQPQKQAQAKSPVPSHALAPHPVSASTTVFYYEFALATRTPGFAACDGLACHTSELPYVFNQVFIFL
jgi:hypothetical protein